MIDFFIINIFYVKMTSLTTKNSFLFLNKQQNIIKYSEKNRVQDFLACKLQQRYSNSTQKTKKIKPGISFPRSRLFMDRMVHLSKSIIMFRYFSTMCIMQNCLFFISFGLTFKAFTQMLPFWILIEIMIFKMYNSIFWR